MCTTGSNKGCACLNVTPDPNVDFFSSAYWDSQQATLAMAAMAPAPTIAPSCAANSGGVNFMGHALADPASWCVCQNSGTSQFYSTISSTWSGSECAYTALPTATISISRDLSGPTGTPTSCRFITNTFTSVGAGPTGVFTSCTCNDNAGYPVTTTVVGGSTSQICQTAGSGPPSPTGGPAASPTCNGDRSIWMRVDVATSAGQQFCSDQNGQGLRQMPINLYAGALHGYAPDTPNDGVNDPGPKIFIYAYIDPACKGSLTLPLNQADCNKAMATIINGCTFSSFCPHRCSF